MNQYFRVTHIFLLFYIVLLLFQGGCAVNPVTGKKEIMLISENMEISMGQEIDRGLRMEYGIYDNPQLNEYIDRLGQQMAPLSHRPHLKYHFAILDTPVENAFAAPGGYIYITRGLMAMLNSEAELVTVLGHELGHVNARHSAKQITRSILVTLGIALASELSEDFRKIAPISMIASQLLFLKYSRNNEYQADALGIEYSLKCNYAAQEMVNFFSSLQRLSNVKGGHHLPNFLSTHPLTPRRIDRIKELLQTEEYLQYAKGSTLSTLKVERNGYLNRLNGLIYGNNPRQGFVQGNAFYHPDMRFSFQIPSQWEVSNTPLQVTMASPDGKAIILLKAENTSQDLSQYTQQMMKELTQPTILQQGYRYINGLNAFHTLASMAVESDTEEQAQQPPLNVQISCIRKSGIVYTFFSAASQNDFSSYQYDINNTVNSFRNLSSPRFLQKRPQRVSLRRSRYNQTLQKFLSRRNIPPKNYQSIAIINGMELNQQITTNQLIKIID